MGSLLRILLVAHESSLLFMMSDVPLKCKDIRLAVALEIPLSYNFTPVMSR